MLNEEDIKKIINNSTLQIPEALELIQQYILDMNGAVIKINTPMDSLNYMLMQKALGISVEYYKNKYKVDGGNN